MNKKERKWNISVVQLAFVYVLAQTEKEASCYIVCNIGVILRELSNQ